MHGEAVVPEGFCSGAIPEGPKKGAGRNRKGQHSEDHPARGGAGTDARAGTAFSSTASKQPSSSNRGGGSNAKGGGT